MNNLKNLCKGAVLGVCLLVSGLMVPTISHAKVPETQAEIQMTYISGYSTELVISSSGLATITGEVRGKSGVTSTFIKVTLQQYVSGTWVDVEDWEASSSGSNAFISETYQVTKGTYRVTMTCSANTETKTATSATRTY